MADAENKCLGLKGCLLNSGKLNFSISSLWLMVSKAFWRVDAQSCSVFYHQDHKIMSFITTGAAAAMVLLVAAIDSDGWRSMRLLVSKIL